MSNAFVMPVRIIEATPATWRARILRNSAASTCHLVGVSGDWATKLLHELEDLPSLLMPTDECQRAHRRDDRRDVKSSFENQSRSQVCGSLALASTDVYSQERILSRQIRFGFV